MSRAEEARGAILAERARREYEVVVLPAYPTSCIADTPVPEGLEGWYAETHCTVEHLGGLPCIWMDYAFFRPDGQWRVLLQSDLFRPGTTIAQRLQPLLSEEP